MYYIMTKPVQVKIDDKYCRYIDRHMFVRDSWINGAYFMKIGKSFDNLQEAKNYCDEMTRKELYYCERTDKQTIVSGQVYCVVNDDYFNVYGIYKSWKDEK